MTSSSKNGSKATARWRRAAPTIPSSSSRAGDALDHGLRVRDGQRDPHARMLALEPQRSSGTTIAAAGRRAELQLAGELALALAGDLVEDLPLEREQPLRATVEPQPGLGRLDAAAGAVEQLCPQPLLERTHLRARRLAE